MENSNLVPQPATPAYPANSAPHATINHRADLDAFLAREQITLTTDQATALSAMVDFLEDENQHIFVLQGFAGTGKTFVLGLFRKWLAEQLRDHQLLAPTGKAVRILAQKTQRSNCYTIHSFLYNTPPLYQETPPELLKSKPEFQWIFPCKQARDLKLINDTVVIVDEASLISDVADDSNYYQFGSGRLLCDLLEALDFVSYPQRKLLFCGDPAQLPPVSMSYSPVFNAKHMQDNYGLSAISSFLLKEVVRQQSNSTILRNATYLREKIEQENFITLSFDLTQPDCQQLEALLLIDSYLQYCRSHRFSDVCIITATNAAALHYNNQVRAQRGFSATNLQRNDLLIISKNNQQYQLFNGDFALVVTVSNEIYPQPSFFSHRDRNGNAERSKITLHFQPVTLLVHAANGTIEQIQVLLLRNFLFEDEGVSAENLMQAVLINCNMRFDEQYPPRKSRDFDTKAEFQDYQQKRKAKREEFMSNDPYFNCLYAKFGYAITCHKAQGSEWQRVYVDCTNRMNGGTKVDEHRCRWLYTAITRAKSELRLINPPHITLGQRFRFSNTPHANGSAAANATYATSTGSSCAASVTAITPATNYSHATDATTTPEANSDTTVASAFASTETTGDTSTSATAAYHTTLVPSSAPFHHPSAPQDYFESLLRKALSGFAITNIAITDANYLKACTISTPDGTFIVNVYYNGKSRITKVYAEAKVLQKFAPQLQALQQQLLQQSILPPQTATISPAAIQAELASLMPRFQDIGAQACAALVKNQLVITSLQIPNPYTLQVEVQMPANGEHGEFNLFWGKKGGTVQWVERTGCTTSLQLKQLVTDIISKL